MRLRRLGVVFALLAGALALLALGLRLALPPDRLARIVVSQAAGALGLDITAGGDSTLTLRGSPTLVLRDVEARLPGTTTSLLRARRILVELPWSTVRSRGATLAVTRVQLDAPELDVAALQSWLATRPSSDSALPTLTGGLQVRDGRVTGAGWRLEALAIDLSRFAPDARVAAKVRGRAVAEPWQAAFDLALSLTRPSGDAAFGIAGTLRPERGTLRLPSRLVLSGALHPDTPGLRIAPLRLAASSRYLDRDTDLPFVLGARATLARDAQAWTLAPLGIALRGEGLLPTLDAGGRLRIDDALALQLDGRLPQWPEGWPALPPPLGASTAPLPFRLAYAGPADLSGTTALDIRQDETHADVAFRLPAILAWIDAGSAGSPLPPLAGRVTTPTAEVSGATLHGVEITFEDDPPPATDP